MGIPVARLIRIMRLPLKDVYRIMRNHYTLFMENWFLEMFDDEKANYIAARVHFVTEEAILTSFTYIENLPESPATNDILDLANQVKSGILAYSYQDPDLNDGFNMGVYADYILEKLNEENS